MSFDSLSLHLTITFFSSLHMTLTLKSLNPLHNVMVTCKIKIQPLTWKATNEPHFSLASCPVMLFFDSQLNNTIHWQRDQDGKRAYVQIVRRWNID